MNLLSIETSCDETAISILNFKKEQDLDEELNFSSLSNHVLSQINIHREFGGVFPSLAKREHAKNIVKIFIECLKEASLYIKKEKKEFSINIKDIENLEEKLYSKSDIKKIKEIKKLLEREPEMFEELINLFVSIEKPDINAISVTNGPGLAPALWVGINFIKALNIFWNINIYPINHMEGHIISSLIYPKDSNNKISKGDFIIKNFNSPAIALLISGGHTEIISFSKLGNYKKIGKTLDDAAGEAFDKVARSLKLPYPGGPEISKIAEACRVNNLKIESKFKLPRPMINSHDLNFSFSGLKTAVIYKIEEMRKNNIDQETIKNTISLDFENSVTEILLKKVSDAIVKTNAKSLLIGGGVIANTHIRKNFTEFSLKENIDLYIPEKFLTGDNAFMIGATAILQILNKKESTDMKYISADSNFNVENI